MRLIQHTLALFAAGALAFTRWAAAQPAPEPPAGDGQMEVLNRGPLHEAFAQAVDSKPAEREVVPKRPPEDVPEQPPDVKPDGNALWIPGYWAWEDSRNDFIWISGVWRVAPPSQRWVPGYWAQAGGGFEWVNGFWAGAAAQQVDYLPPPPESLEQGPTSPAPSDDYFWIPGCWVNGDSGYVWRAGYWARSQADWMWVPDQYSYSPSGYVYNRGYWDYPIERRGWCFAPVWFNQGYYSRPGYFYRPSVLLQTSALLTHFFVRPNWRWYYFGDYYDRSYASAGFYPWFHANRRGYDPFYAYYGHRYGRNDRNWTNNWERDFARRQQNERDRPEHVYRPQQRDNRDSLSVGLNQFVNRNDVRNRVQRVSEPQRRTFEQNSQRLTEIRKERAQVERGDVASRDNAGDDRGRKHTVLRLPTPDNVTGPAGRVPDRVNDRGQVDRGQGNRGQTDRDRGDRDRGGSAGQLDNRNRDGNNRGRSDRPNVGTFPPAGDRDRSDRGRPGVTQDPRGREVQPPPRTREAQPKVEQPRGRDSRPPERNRGNSGRERVDAAGGREAAPPARNREVQPPARSREAAPRIEQSRPREPQPKTQAPRVRESQPRPEAKPAPRGGGGNQAKVQAPRAQAPRAEAPRGGGNKPSGNRSGGGGDRGGRSGGKGDGKKNDKK